MLLFKNTSTLFNNTLHIYTELHNSKRLTNIEVNLLWHFWSTKVLAICPWQRISKNVCCDCPVACAKVNPSAMVAMKLPWTMLRISIILAAFPASPASHTGWSYINLQHTFTCCDWEVPVPIKKDVFPIAWKQLLQSSYTLRSPAATMTSIPSLESCWLPETGASRNLPPLDVMTYRFKRTLVIGFLCHVKE